MKTFLAALAMVALPASALAQMGMPDARQMSGMPLPVAEMTPGTVTVRVVRGVVSNAIPNQAVELTADGATKSVVTDQTGRATFEGLKIGSTVTVRTTVGEETLESQAFPVPPQGGVRVMLVARDPEVEEALAEAAKAAAASAQPGTVALGSQSRIHVELTEEAADVYYLLDVVNASSAPVQPKSPFELKLPDGATGSTILEGSTPNATAAGRDVKVRGPFAPGQTVVQIAYRLPYSGGQLAFAQAFPAAFDQPVLTVTKKLPSVRLSSSAFHDAREMPNEGQMLLVAHAKATPAGAPLDVKVEGVPSHPLWPRYLALALVAAILGAGAWGAITGPRRASERSAAAKQLEARREKLLSEMASLEERHRAGSIPDGQYDRRRREIIDALERVYGDLDQGAAA